MTDTFTATLIQQPQALTATMITAGPAGTVSAAGPGTALLPSISFAADPNTGFYNPAPDQIGFTAGGVRQLIVGVSTIGFYGATATPKPTVSGSRSGFGGAPALASLLTALSTLGLVTDSSTP